MSMLLVPLVFGFLGLDLDIGYLFQLARGQVGLLVRQEPIGRVLERADLSPETARRLRYVEKVRAFGIDSLGLEASKNYTTFVNVEGRAVVWNLTVAPKDRLEPLTWNYPIVGKVPYRGYFKRDKAEEEAAQWEGRGYDVYLRPVSAYSTLGWFTDPVLSTMLLYSDADLASVILHEMTHATLWIEDDPGFNESLAAFVGDTGGLAYLESVCGPGSPEVQETRDSRADGALFRRLMHQLAAELDHLYGKGLPLEETLRNREELFAAAADRLAGQDWLTDAYGEAPAQTFNNARLAAFRVYYDGDELFRRVYESLNGDLRAALEVYRRCEGARDPAGYLNGWLSDRAAPKHSQ